VEFDEGGVVADEDDEEKTIADCRIPELMKFR
jgi:hypothetical protein